MGRIVKAHEPANRLDRAIGYFAPARMARRVAARVATQELYSLRGGYRSARSNRGTEDWLVSRGSADADILGDLPTLRSRSRELVRNTGIASGVLGSIVDEVVGSGLRSQSNLSAEHLALTAEKAEAAKSGFESQFKRWMPFADASDHVGDWFEIQRLAYRSMLEGGDVFLHPVVLDREPKGGRTRPLGTALQLIEADRVCNPRGMRVAENGNEIRDGVELDSVGRPVAYWVRKTHPGDALLSIAQRQTANDFDRIPKWSDRGRPQMIHLFEPLRVGQTRGVPILAPIMLDLRNLDQYLSAELMAKRLLACIGLLIENPFLADGFAVGTESSGTSETGPGSKETKWKPGMIFEGRPGQKIEAFNPNRPDQNFDPFTMHMLRVVACGLGTTYELLMKDFTKTTFASGKLSESHLRTAVRRQQRSVDCRLLQPVVAMVNEEAYLRGLVQVPKQITRLSMIDWFASMAHGTRGTFMQPDKEVKASGLSMKQGTSNLMIECAEQGRDWEEVMHQRSREVQLADKLGVELEIDLSPDPVEQDPADLEAAAA